MGKRTAMRLGTLLAALLLACQVRTSTCKSHLDRAGDYPGWSLINSIFSRTTGESTLRSRRLKDKKKSKSKSRSKLQPKSTPNLKSKQEPQRTPKPNSQPQPQPQPTPKSEPKPPPMPPTSSLGRSTAVCPRRRDFPQFNTPKKCKQLCKKDGKKLKKYAIKQCTKYILNGQKGRKLRENVFGLRSSANTGKNSRRRRCRGWLMWCKGKAARVKKNKCNCDTRPEPSCNNGFYGVNCKCSEDQSPCKNGSTYKLRFLKIDPKTRRPLPFLSSTDLSADVLAPWGAGPMFPSVVELPSENRRINRVHPEANFYLYYSAHRDRQIRMAWAPSLEGPWTDYHNPKFCQKGIPYEAGGCQRGVMPVGREWDHVSSPHVLFNQAHERFVMYYHGGYRGGRKKQFLHSNFVASSSDGADFSGSYTNSSILWGQGTAMREENDSRSRQPLALGTVYSRPFDHNAEGDENTEFYVIGKRGQVCKLPSTIWSSRTDTWETGTGDDDLYQNAAKCDEVPENEFHIADDPPVGSGFFYKYTSPLTEFLASREFAEHANNPHPGETVHSFANMTNRELAYETEVFHRANHVGIFKGGVDADELEVFFSVLSPRLRDGRRLDTFKGLYRVVYDLRDHRTEEQKRDGIEPFEVWRLERGADGRVIFEEVISPKWGKWGLGSLGDSFVQTFSDGRNYIFFSTGPEGDIFGAELQPL